MYTKHVLTHCAQMLVAIAVTLLCLAGIARAYVAPVLSVGPIPYRVLLSPATHTANVVSLSASIAYSASNTTTVSGAFVTIVNPCSQVGEGLASTASVPGLTVLYYPSTATLAITGEQSYDAYLSVLKATTYFNFASSSCDTSIPRQVTISLMPVYIPLPTSTMPTTQPVPTVSSALCPIVRYADIVVMLDVSLLLNTSFANALNFTSNVISQLSIGPDQTRCAIYCDMDV